jgi:AcrR family transcriptional regulator
VRTAQTASHRRLSDLTARARIREAAIQCFAEDGFDASFRTIAARAAVSPGLITHHFGSKSALRAECDDEVLRRYRELKSAGISEPAAVLMSRLSAPGFSADLLVYILRAVHAGGQGASTFLEHLINDMRAVMAESVAAGLVRPSRDEEARLRYITYQTIGALLVQFLTMQEPSPEHFVASLRDGRHETILPMLELFTEGFMADRSLLDDYVRYLWEPPDATADVLSQHTTDAVPPSLLTT